MFREIGPGRGAINQVQQGMPLSFGPKLFGDGNNLQLFTLREEDREHRFKVIAKLDDKHWTAIFLLRGGKRHYISVRTSNDDERMAYDRD